MEITTYRDRLRSSILKTIQDINLNDSEWRNNFATKWVEQQDRTEVLWLLKDLVQNGEYIEKAFLIAEMYADDINPEPEYDQLNQKIEKGEEIGNIYTVRGTVPWLLQAIIGTLKTEYYPRILDLVDKLASDPIFYVRQQSVVPLSSFAINIYAKQNKDGTIFNFNDEDRKRVVALAVRMMWENRHLPRVLEHLADVFDKLRLINESLAQDVLTTFFYETKGKLNPPYLTEHVAPISVFYAEFRKKYDPNFDNQWFQQFLIQLIRDANKNDSRLKTTLIWHTWKVIKDDATNYQLVKKYIPLFFEGNFDYEPVGQFEILALEVLKVSYVDGLDVFKKELDFILNGIIKLEVKKQVWFSSTQEVLEYIAEKNPADLLPVFPKLRDLLLSKVYIGDITQIFSLYKLAPDNLELKKKATEIYAQLKHIHPE